MLQSLLLSFLTSFRSSATRLHHLLLKIEIAANLNQDRNLPSSMNDLDLLGEGVVFQNPIEELGVLIEQRDTRALRKLWEQTSSAKHLKMEWIFLSLCHRMGSGQTHLQENLFNSLMRKYNTLPSSEQTIHHIFLCAVALLLITCLYTISNNYLAEIIVLWDNLVHLEQPQKDMDVWLLPSTLPPTVDSKVPSEMKVKRKSLVLFWNKFTLKRSLN